VLIGLPVLLLLVGGGIAPPVMGVVVGAVATRIHTAPRRPVGRTGRAGAALWPWFLAAAVAGYLALVPGVPIASVLGVASEAMVIGLAAFAFANLGLALVGGPRPGSDPGRTQPRRKIMKVLVGYARRHGSTAGIAERIAAGLRQEGLSAEAARSLTPITSTDMTHS
jgi:hypothetical protein